MRFSSSAVSFFILNSLQNATASVAFAGVSAVKGQSKCSTCFRKFSTLKPACTSRSNKRNKPRWLVDFDRPTQSSTCKELYTGFGGLSQSLGTRGGGLLSLHSASTSTIADETTETKIQEPIEIFRLDYKPLPYVVSTVDMKFEMYDGKTVVTTTMNLVTNPMASDLDAVTKQLILDGEQESVKLLSISMNGKDLVEGIDYELLPENLILKNPKDGAIITTTVEIVPENNTKLAGLYKSSGMYCTQCEAVGFRRITYFPDRPDNMSIFQSVRIEADKEKYPLLLSNGNLVEEGLIENSNRHYAIWSDPFPKPSYLFAAVAGNLGKIEDTFTTKSGRVVKLALYSEPKNVGKLHYAMDALKKSMKWDEDRFNLEYDLDIFNVVAVGDFNMGAMENKSLNIFNSALLLADEKTATDSDFQRIEGVVAHEYFHNWTGNRVTCRDWFQLTLKEGLTVFRDQEFSGDMNSVAVQRIEDVKALRARQFGEDAGPMAHPIRPESYIAMDNFYTSTVYEKGAEVIRMYQTILGVEGFNKGMALYFERHDGQAVTCEDFLNAMADANGVDLSVFKRWYSTPGTPTVKYSVQYNEGVATLMLSQISKRDDPLQIPIAIGLLDKSTGEEVVPTTVLNFKEMTQTFTFSGLNGEVIPSILRGFSAPVKLVKDPPTGDEEKELAFLAAHDTDGFNRWESGQKLYTALIFQTLHGEQSPQTLEYVYEAFGRTLAADDTTMDHAIKSYGLMLPGEMTLAEELDVVDPIALHKARGLVKKAIARRFQSEIQEQYDVMTAEMEAERAEGSGFQVNALAIGRRQLRNVYLDYLCSIRETDTEKVAAAQLATKHYHAATCMTDKMAAFMALASMDGVAASYRDSVVEDFYREADGDPLVLNKWFSVQALADLPDILDRIKELKRSPDFTLTNPNRVRSLIGSFASNPVAFHDESGAGYELFVDVLQELDPINPLIASRLTASSLIKWKRFNPTRAEQMKAALERLMTSPSLSKELFEIASKGLK